MCIVLNYFSLHNIRRLMLYSLHIFEENMKHITYIREHPDWTEWQWSDKKLLPLVSRARILQGSLLRKLLTLGFDLNVEAQLDAVTLKIFKTSDIESE